MSYGLAMAQVHSLYADGELIGRCGERVRHMAWIGAASLYFVASYPFQGVIYSWCGDSAQIAFVVLGGVSALATLSMQRRDVFPYRRATWVVTGGLTLTMLTTLAIYGNLTVVRELLLLVAVAAAVRAASAGETELLRAFVYVTVVAFIPAFLGTAMFYAHWIDWPSWSVEHLGLPDTNPLRIRQQSGDFDYYLPLWISVVPNAPARDQGFGLSFVRQSFLYTEPSALWYFVAGPFWIALADTRMPARRLCLAVLGIALLLSFSVFGILVTAAALTFAAAMALGGRLLVSFLAIGIVVALPFVPVNDWVQLLGSNKADELAFYTQNVTVFSDLTLLGHAASHKEQPLSYGFLAVLYRYGIVGFAANLCASAAILWASFRLLRDAATLGWRRFPLFVACFLSVALLVKGTAIVPTMAALSLAAALGVRQRRLDPVSRTRRS